MITTPETDRRLAPRRTTLKGGLIMFNGGRSSIDCTVRNLSTRGARLRVTSVVGIPGTFDLVLENTRPQPCRVVWRTLKEIGVAFGALH